MDIRYVMHGTELIQGLGALVHHHRDLLKVEKTLVCALGEAGGGIEQPHENAQVEAQHRQHLINNAATKANKR